MNFDEAVMYARQKEDILGNRFLTPAGSEYEIEQIFVYYLHSSKEQLWAHYKKVFPEVGQGFIATAANMTQADQFDVYAAAYNGTDTFILPIDQFSDYGAL